MNIKSVTRVNTGENKTIELEAQVIQEQPPEVAVSLDYDALTKKELIVILKEKNIEYNSRDTKTVLVELLKGDK